MRGNRLLRQAYNISQESGFLELMLRSLSFCYRKTLRPFLPQTGYYTKAGVATDVRRSLDSLIPRLPYEDNPNHESALVDQLKKYTQSGDYVVIVGAGSGTTTVIAAEEVGTKGKVTAFEGSLRAFHKTQKTLSLNEVQNRCEVRHAIVGEAIQLAGGNEPTGDTHEIPSSDLPECDVLELDCEGAELRILAEMTINPRVVIVETHPHFDSPPEFVSEVLEEIGYEIINQVNRHSVPVVTAVRQNS